MADPKSAVVRALRAALARLGLDDTHTIVVGFSGGQDSTCLLHALQHLRKRPRLVAAHVDHALRPDSAASAAEAAELALRIGVEARVVRVDVTAYKRQRSSWSVQHAARAARYQALAAVAEELGAAAVVTAHTADDQAETVLLNLLRGTGLRGLAGIRLDDVLDLGRIGPLLATHMTVPARVRVARPLLKVPRATTLAYCAHFGLSVVQDGSNLSRAYTRNRVRLDLLPALERFNPAIRSVLARTADLATEDLAALDAVVDQCFARIVRQRSDVEIGMDLQAWRAEPRALQRRLLRHAIQLLLGDLADVSAASIDDALDIVRSGRPGQAYHLPYGIELCIDVERARLRRFGRARRRASNITEGRAVTGV